MEIIFNQALDYFVGPTSIGRRIWGTADTVLFVFAGAAAELALNKAVCAGCCGCRPGPYCGPR